MKRLVLFAFYLSFFTPTHDPKHTIIEIVEDDKKPARFLVPIEDVDKDDVLDRIVNIYRSTH